jgi:hypothetical protein
MEYNRKLTKILEKMEYFTKASVSKAFTNIYPNATTEIITPVNFVEFVY